MIETLNIYKYENELIEKGITYICGVDEAGRGPLAGDLVVASVILPLDYKIEGLNDSKVLSSKRRDFLFDEILKHAIDYSIVFINPSEIDKYNIYHATQVGMMRCIDNLKIKAEHALIDAMPLPELTIDSTSIIKGDKKSASIAAASILAKVSRDRYMEKMNLLYPLYSFDKHKGYPTKLHFQLLEKYGPCEIHRKSFKPVAKFFKK